MKSLGGSSALLLRVNKRVKPWSLSGQYAAKAERHHDAVSDEPQQKMLSDIGRDWLAGAGRNPYVNSR